MTNANSDIKGECEFLSATQLEEFTGTPASTFRYWAHVGSGPPSFKLGRRRLWRRSVVLEWIAAQEIASASGTGA